ncbi:MAG: Phosphoserine phosphatase 1 [Acidobacteria bacterium ADurb.Bin340]|nr:MAG: Phosphoserine phosphatase 1 [Acidobacteria bacterium ADurb.Bin340]HQL47872.1 histidine phosphatase family protein [Holophaga sp.]
MRIVLVRHGETAWNVEGRHQGRGCDIGLSEAGRSQAGALAERLAGQTWTRTASSPLKRARETAERLLEGADTRLILDPDLEEISHGAWEGLLASEVRDRWPDLQRAWRERPDETRLPGGETLAEVQARAWRALERLTEGLGATETLLVVTHDGVNRVLLCRVLGLPLARVWAFRQAPTGFSLLEGPDLEGLSVLRLNDAAHVAPLFGEPVHRRI